MAGLHGSARTTPRVRAELQAAQPSARLLAAQHGLKPKTVLNWRKRDGAADAAMGAKPRGTALTEAEDAIVVEFRRRVLRPLDDVLGHLEDQIPTLTQSALRRCLQPHGISWSPESEEASPKREAFNEAEIGCVHVDGARLRAGRPQSQFADNRLFNSIDLSVDLLDQPPKQRKTIETQVLHR